jgi:hydroxypyruvate isomerase
VAHSLRYLANCSIMFTELPLLQRPAAARSAGFEAVEFWWPFDRPVPGDAAARIGSTVFIEPLSGPGTYPLRLAADAAAVVGRARAAGAENVGILFDLYHLATNGDDIDRAIAAQAGRIAHVQIADPLVSAICHRRPLKRRRSQP